MTQVPAVIPPMHDALRELHGRIFNQDKIYMLPADETEMDRLSLQNLTLRLLIGGPTPLDDRVLNNILCPRDGHTPAIIDVGSGSGIWTVDIARQYPQARVVGFDLAPGQPLSTPTNCIFMQGDADRDLDQFAGQFDIVHCRSMAHGTTDFAHVLRQMTKCLRPGGLLVLAGGDLRIYDEHKQPIADPSKSAVARLLLEVQAVDAKRGAATVKSDAFFGHLQRAPELVDVQQRAYHCPIKWAGLPEDNLADGERLGRLMKQNCEVFVHAWKPLLLTARVPPDLVDEWIRKAEEELAGVSRRCYTKWHYAWAFKRA